MRAVLSLLLLVWVCHANASDPDPITAQASVINWLELLDQAKYEDTWESAAPVFKEALSAKQWARAAGSARKPLGTLVSRELIGTQYRNELPGVPEGDYVIFQFKSSFEKRNEVIETVTPTLVEGHWRVSGYYVR